MFTLSVRGSSDEVGYNLIVITTFNSIFFHHTMIIYSFGVEMMQILASILTLVSLVLTSDETGWLQLDCNDVNSQIDLLVNVQGCNSTCPKFHVFGAFSRWRPCRFSRRI